MEIEISNFLGIQSSNISPPKDACVVCDNLDVRGDTGALITRMGYDNKYDSPVDSRGKLSGQADIGFCNFYVPDNGGQEITILLQKAILAGETGIGYTTPSSLNILAVWARPYWGLVISGSISSATTITVTTNITTTANQYVGKYIISGSETREILSHTTGANTVFTTEPFTTVPSGTCYINGWIDSWLWLNQCILTTINTVNASTWKLELDFNDVTLKTDGLNKWSIINISKSPKEIAKIINTYQVTGNQVGIEITRSQHNWIGGVVSPLTVGDSVLITKNYIPYDYLTGMYNCNIADITFHKVNNDLRIGFGGQENRLGLSIGYRKKFLRLNKFNFGSLDAEITAFSTIDELILDPYNCFGMEAQIQLTAVTDATYMLPTATYYFKLVARLDNFEQFIIAENSLAVDVSNQKVINYNILINAGSVNKRITDISFYWSNDNINWWTLGNEYEITSLTTGSKELLINVTGDLVLSELADVTEINNVSNAINPTSDANSVSPYVADWDADSIATETTTPTPAHGTYCMKVTTTEAGHYSMIRGGLPAYLIVGRTYNITFKARSQQEITLNYGLAGEGNQAFGQIINNSGWSTITFECKIYPNSSLFFQGYIATGEWFAIDQFSVKDRYYSDRSLTSLLVEDSDKINEIIDELGYAPTNNYALSWDQVVVTKKKTFMVSPYFLDGGRILNNIFYSPLSGDGESQYDVITPGKFYPQDNYDGNDLIGLQVLSNLDFLGIRRNSVQWIDSDTGISKEVRYGNGVVNNRGVVNFGEHVVYPGENDISLVNPLRAIDISEGTIRTLYRALTKANIIATREERDNAYRFFTGNTTTKQEYILTKRGWIGAKRYLYPKAYTIAKDGTVWFLGSDGKIYYDETVDGDNGAPISYNWRSVVFDQSLMGEQIKGDERFYLQMLWFRYKLIYPATTFTVKLYLDKACKASDYAAGVTYILGDVVVYGGTRWKSLQNSNTGNTPSEGAWWTAVSYYQSFSVDANYGYFSMPIVPGASCREFQIDISGVDDFGAKVEIYSVGIEFTTIPIGVYAKIP